MSKYRSRDDKRRDREAEGERNQTPVTGKEIQKNREREEGKKIRICRHRTTAHEVSM